MRKSNHSIGDIVYFEDFFGNVSLRPVLDIEPRSYVDDNGNVVHYFMYTVGKHEAIEDYNCLDENDSRIKEYLKHNRKTSLNSIIETLSNISKTYGGEDMPVFINDEFVASLSEVKVGSNCGKHFLSLKLNY